MKRLIAYILVVLTVTIVFAGCSLLGAKEETQATEEETIIVTEKPTEFEYSKDPKDYVETAVSEEHGDFIFEYPRILIDSEDADTANLDIEDTYQPVLNIFAEADSSHQCTSIQYEANVANEVLSVVVDAIYNNKNDFYSVYNFDIKTGNFLNNDQLIEKLGLNKDEVYSNLKKAFENEYNDLYKEDYSDDKDFDDCLSKTLDDDNIKDARLFISSDGLLKCIAPIFSVRDLTTHYVEISL